MNILSIQSHVVYGHVGNAAATFVLQRLGAEVWPIHTVQFSNHTGYGAARGEAFGAPLIRELVEGLAERGALATCDGVLSGYIGAAEIGDEIVAAVGRVKAANARARYCCDPVIGDVGRGVYVRPGVAEFMRERALTVADIVTPNQFELDFLSGGASKTIAEALRACEALHALGPRTVLATSLALEDTPKEAVDLFASGPDGRFRLRTPRLPLAVNGAGDAMAALFFLHLLREGSTAAALSQAASAVFGVLARTQAAGARELLLVAAQEELVRPSRLFRAEAVL